MGGDTPNNEAYVLFVEWVNFLRFFSALARTLKFLSFYFLDELFELVDIWFLMTGYGNVWNLLTYLGLYVIVTLVYLFVYNLPKQLSTFLFNDPIN